MSTDKKDPIVEKVYEIYGPVIKTRRPVRSPDAMLKILREEYKLLVNHT
jgi:hypothetical protein